MVDYGALIAELVTFGVAFGLVLFVCFVGYLILKHWHPGSDIY